MVLTFSYFIFVFENDEGYEKRLSDIFYEVRNITTRTQTLRFFPDRAVRVECSLRRGHRPSELGWEIYKILANNPPMRCLESVTFFEEEGKGTVLYPSRPIAVS